MVARAVVSENLDWPRQGMRRRGRAHTRILLGSLAFGSVGLATSGVFAPILNNPDTVYLPYFALLTLSRMTIAYALSLAFALAYGITAAMQHRAAHVMLPLLDILQSVPALAFLPVVFVFFIQRFPGGFGAEVSSIILIFTAMVWAPTFGVIAGVNSIPQDIKEVSKAYGIGGWRYLRHIVLPALFPELVWSSVLAWGGGWYFIPVEEYFTFAGQTHTLKGIGFYIAQAASNSDLASSVFGLLVLIGIIVMIDRFVWRPLEQRADRYKYETVGSATIPARRERRVVATVRRAEGRVVSPILSFLKYERAFLSSFLESVHLRPRLHISDRIRLQERWSKHVLIGRILSVGIFIGLLGVVFVLLAGQNVPSSLGQAITTLRQNVGFLNMAYYTARSLLRIFTAYTIALGWTLGAGILIARSEKVSKLLVPLFDIGQSIPATALFPIIILLLVRPFEGNPGTLAMSLEVASTLLLLGGMQWYILFNIVGAIHNIPGDILEASSAYRIRGRRFARGILIPAAFPAIIVGSIQAWGGGWNGTIVSEYITVAGQNGPTNYQVPGLGALLNNAVANPSPYASAVIIVATMITMTFTVLIINRVFWRRLLKKVDKYKFEA